MSQKYEKLKALLKELFQLDQPDLDFGFYRVMHARAAEVTQFLEQDLLPQVKAAFAQYQPADKAAIEKELAKVIAGIEAAGMNPEDSPKVKELRAKLADDAVDLDALEAEVYDHLFSFFRRYYSEGDFLSKRVYKPGVYAIPYEGEEVKLHWANADQYYIKTSEYLRDYAFRLRPGDDKNPMRVHFRLVDAAEGQHGNIKEQAGRERRFKLAAAPFAAVEDGELVIRFTYEPDPAKQKELNAAATAAILGLADALLVEWQKLLGETHVRADGTASDTTRLRVHLDRYTARNTFDYFIHKDLGGFLRRELDFYIKNEVMHLDDVENESVPRVEQYLSKIKVIRRIAGKIITFLAQLEDFQKKLWLKKKFVVETSWCIRLGVIPEEFYPEIAANDAQREEWVRLHAIDELKPVDRSLLESGKPGYSVPLTVGFLKAHPTLMVDTRHFDAGFTARLLEAIGELDEQTDGVLFHSENFQALSVMQARYREQVKCIYIDPPYNTGSDGFAYKDSYPYSSWLTLLDDRVALARTLLESRGVFLSSVDDIEHSALVAICESHFSKDGRIGNLVWKGATDNNPTRIAVEHEYILCYAKSNSELEENWSTESSDTKELMLSVFDSIRKKTTSVSEREALFSAFATENRETLGDLFRYRRVDARGPFAARRNMENPGKPGYQYDVLHPATKKVCAKPYWGWRFPERTMRQFLDEDRIIFGKDENKIPELKVYLSDVRFPLRSVFHLDARKGSNDLDRLFGARDIFKNPKPVEVLTHFLPFTSGPKSIPVDFFAGSGTTGHAVINLNREDGGQRKFILVEQADCFDTVLVPRLKKVTFTPEWKDGQPKRLATAEEAERSPRIMKGVRLESYEDTLNNLELRRIEQQQGRLDLAEAKGADKFREEYMLRYLLDVEARGSQSLLNVAAFTDPIAYELKVKRPGSDESREVNVDLLETFNWLIGLTVQHIAAPQTFSAETERDGEGRLRLKGRLRPAPNGGWWFRTVTGTTPDGRRTLVIWRKRPGGETPEGVEQDNLILDEWFTRQGYSSKDSEFDLIYVNGGNNLENLKAPDDSWKVRLIEEDFFRLMFDTEGV
ncbi:MAG TPA: DNA methyltransferase [Vicinamibacterales bacterium]|nr:DNA methyltransferase [Vicinamibacterales bacterium]HPK70698.1 DNA methyltransferase [Vicinamibacterales bacterium]